jgi:hypothetical protein
LWLGASRATAQEQERKLLDRLLKPDMSLQNNAQEKQFVAGGATVEKKARTKQFHVRERSFHKQFQGRRNVTTREFNTATSRFGRAEANVTTRHRIPNAELTYSTPGYREVRAARDAEKTAESTAYSGTRPFTPRGKSQKFLSAQDRPLTIDQVRELLNKNK